MGVEKSTSEDRDQEFKKAFETLYLKIKTLEAESIAKTEFIANLIHDIRSPLTGIVSLSSHLYESTESPKEKEWARVVHEGSLQLLDLLNNVLNSGQKTFLEDKKAGEEVFNLSELIKKIRELEEPSVIDNNLLLEVNIDSKVPEHFFGDKLKLQRILLNLVSNAIKFTKKGKISIEVRLVSKAKETAYVEFLINDTGVGIPEKKQDKVFTRFFKMNSTQKAKRGSNGLGLDIVQKYVQLLGGKIRLQSKEGEGSIFSFVLPMKIDMSFSNKVLKTDIKQKKNAHTAVEEHSEKLRLLLVEDNPIAMISMKLMMNNMGIEPETAFTSEAAMDAIRKQVFDLIITDIELSDGSGYGLSKKIRAMEKEVTQKPVQIIGLTGHSATEIAPLCKDAGMDDVYQKPMEVRLLTSLVARVLQEKDRSDTSSPTNRISP